MLTVDGYDVRIDHFRLSEEQMHLFKKVGREGWLNSALTAGLSITALRKNGSTIAPCGGFTVAQVYEGEQMVAEGVAVCSPEDNFNKKIGRAIATGRALKELK